MRIFFLGDSALDNKIGLLGGKAANLHLLKRGGFCVPPGFVLLENIDNISNLIESIGGFPVAVRSSCSMEDLANASFAGLYETFLNVKSLNELNLTINKCLESKSSHRVQDYLRSKGISVSPDQLQMSVLVQKMVDSEVAGVLFTLNPINGREEEFYIEYCQGLGERLVSGHVTPSRCRYQIFNHQVIDSVINAEGTVIEDRLLRELVEVSKKVQAYFGCPQDIEWGIDRQGVLHILQSRPVTTYSTRDDVPELTNADLKDGGVSARVCTPCMFSLYRNALQFSMGDYLKRINLITTADKIVWIYHFYGRVYWNAGAVKEGLKKIPGYFEADLDKDLGIQKDYGSKGPHRTETSMATIIGAIPVLIGMYKEFRDCENMIALFRNNFEANDLALKSNMKSLSQMSNQAFVEWLKEVLLFQNRTEKNYFRTIYNNSNFQTEFKTLVKSSKTFKEGDELDLMSGLSGVSHTDVQSDLEQLAGVANSYGFESTNYLSAREKFISVHYHHGPAELDITVERWGERKDWVDELVKSFTHRNHQDNSSYLATANRIALGLSFFGRWKFWKMLTRSRNYLVSREGMRSYSTRAYYLVRIGLLEFSKRYQIEDRLVFMMDIDEVMAFINGNIKPLNLEDRYLSYQALRKFSPPNEFGGAIVWAKSQSADGILKGIGCSPGEFIGRARVIIDIHATHLLTKDDILITVFTDPGWTPVLARVGGVVTEVGGLLSHAAVIGREYGIPAVLNLQNATQLIPDGALVRINGKSGEVEVLEKGP